MADLAALNVKRGNLVEQISSLAAETASLERSLARAEADLSTAQDPRQLRRIQQRIDTYKSGIATNAGITSRLQTELRSVDAQIAQAQAQQGAQVSSGQVVKQGQAARDDGASATSPPPAAQNVDASGRVVKTNPSSVPSNAQKFVPGQTDAGTNATTRKAANLQSTPPITARPGGINQDDAPQPTNRSGAASGGDDAASSGGVRAQLNNLFGGAQNRIVPQDNILDQYASYSYNISLYLMSPEDYRKLIRNKQKTIAGFQLMVQSGGAGPSGQLTPVNQVDPNIEDPTLVVQEQLKTLNRNQFFPLDYYLDNIKLTTSLSGKGTNSAHTATGLEFTLVEPNGITFLDNLYAATQQYISVNNPGINNKNYGAQTYLMVIRFYGYDENGNIVTAGKTGSGSSGSDVNAIVEKFIPFQFTAIKFRIHNKLVEYQCQAVTPQINISTGRARGVLPYNIELQSQTLKDLLTGATGFIGGASANAQTEGRESAQQADIRRADNIIEAQNKFEQEQRLSEITHNSPSLLDLEFGGTAAVAAATGAAVPSTSTIAKIPSAPPKADAVRSKALVSGLQDALNKYQDELVKEGIQDYPDRYTFILDPLLADAKVVPPGQSNLKQTPMTQAQTANQQKNPATQQVNNNAKNTSGTAGTSIVKFLDDLVRTTTYIYDQQIFIIDPKTGQLTPQGTPAEVVGWYRIGLEAVPQRNKFDSKRNDWAYDITYSINAFAVADVKSDFFPQSRYRGAQKSYNYWFTGENTQVMEFTQDFNYLYYIVSNGPRPETQVTPNAREIEKRYYQSKSPQSSQGQNDDNVNEASANAADYIYSPADQARVHLKIVGDPAWIFQGETWSGINLTGFNYGPFLADGTVNYEGQDALFEVGWNQPVDYDLGTGIADPSQKNYKRTATSAGEPQQKLVYKAITCTSYFTRGQFYQDLSGTLMLFPLPDKNTEVDVSRTALAAQGDVGTAPSAFLRGPDQSAAETNRLNARKPVNSGLATANVNAARQAERQQAAASKVNTARRDQYGRLASFGNQSPEVSYGSADIADPQAQLMESAASGAPTSGGQPVGAASSTNLAVARSSGQVATGTAVGQPVTVPVRTISGATINVTSQGEISDLYVNDKISRAEYERSSARLEISQARANAPVTSKPNQKIARET